MTLENFLKKLIINLIILSSLLSYGIFKSQISQKYIEIKWKNGSKAAQKIMKSDFYYDVLDSWSPFGNDVGNDTYYLYCDWKLKHPTESIRKFIDHQLIDLGYPEFDISITNIDVNQLNQIVNKMHNQYVDLNNIDNMIISLAFTQLFIEGKIQSDVKKWAEAAFSREVLYLDFWENDKERIERKERMNQLLTDLSKG